MRKVAAIRVQRRGSLRKLPSRPAGTDCKMFIHAHGGLLIMLERVKVMFSSMHVSRFPRASNRPTRAVRCSYSTAPLTVRPDRGGCMQACMSGWLVMELSMFHSTTVGSSRA